MSQFDLSLPHDFNGQVRLFPLSGVVLYPGIIQGLHIFEPRYKAMTADALSGDQLIALAIPVGEGSSPDRPRLFPLACLGRIVSHTELEEGRYNLLLLGLRRIRIMQELDRPDQPWRTAEVRLMHDRVPDAPEQIEESRQWLLTAFQSMAKATGTDLSPFQSVDPAQIPLGILADTFAYMANLDLRQQLMVLEETDAVKRAVLVSGFLKKKAATAVPAGHSGPNPGFPPPFSLN